MSYVFFRKFLKTHFVKSRFIYVVLFFVVIYLIFSPQEGNKLNRIIEGMSISYIAAYIFYIFLNVMTEYFVQKKALLVNKEFLNAICSGIAEILSTIKLFSDENFSNIQIPDEIVYVKRKDNTKTFFVPRCHLEECFLQIEKNIKNINRFQYFSLPLELCEILVNIEKNSEKLSRNLKWYYGYFDNGESDKIIIGIRDFSEYLLDLKNEYEQIRQYLFIQNQIEGYVFLSKTEEKDYQNYRRKMLGAMSIKPDKSIKRVYRGKNRIL